MFSSLIYFYLFFLYISFGTFFGQGIAPASQRGVQQNNQNMESDIYGNTALPLAPDLQSLQTPQAHTRPAFPKMDPIYLRFLKRDPLFMYWLAHRCLTSLLKAPLSTWLLLL